MGDKTGIEWTDATWNPVTGCTKVSQGCKHCYAERVFPRTYAKEKWPIPTVFKLAPGVTKTTHTFRPRRFTDVMTHPYRLDMPLRWKRPRRIFVNSMSDLFHENVPFEFIDEVFAVMLMAPQHTFQALTKRPARMLEYMEGRDLRQPIAAAAKMAPKRAMVDMEWPPRNAWLGVSVEDQATAIERIPLLMKTPAAVRWISAEPLLGPIDLDDMIVPDGSPGENHMSALDCDVAVEDDEEYHGATLDWVVVGGESGPGARPMHPDWARSLRDQCVAAGVPYLFKQWGEHEPVYDREREDPDWRRCKAVEDAMPQGRWLNLAGGHGFHGERLVYVDRVGKKRAGRTLDGRTWDEYPS